MAYPYISSLVSAIKILLLPAKEFWFVKCRGYHEVFAVLFFDSRKSRYITFFTYCSQEVIDQRPSVDPVHPMGGGLQLVFL